jgi:hypothetical protein
MWRGSRCGGDISTRGSCAVRRAATDGVSSGEASSMTSARTSTPFWDTTLSTHAAR